MAVWGAVWDVVRVLARAQYQAGAMVDGAGGVFCKVPKEI